VLAGAGRATKIGSEFMPPLNEATCCHAVTDPSVSLDENTDIAAGRTPRSTRVPEVAYAVAKSPDGRTRQRIRRPNMTERLSTETTQHGGNA